MPPNDIRRRLAYPLLGAVCLALSLVVGWSAYGQRVNRIFYDLYFRQRGAAAPAEEIVIVAIDDATLAEAGPLPLDRARLAEGLRLIRDAKPLLIAVDILLTDAGRDAEADMELRRAISGTSMNGLPTVPSEPGGIAPLQLKLEPLVKPVPVILATVMDAGGGRWLDPQPQFALSAAAVGHAHADPDGDGVTRRVLLEKQSGGQHRWALALETFRILIGAAQSPITEADDYLELKTPLTTSQIAARRADGRALLINYAGGNDTFPEISFASLGKDPEVAQQLRSKIVLVGVTAQASGDRLFTPFSAGVGMPGVEIHANILHTLLTQLLLLPVGETQAAMGLAAVVLATLWGLARLHGLWQWLWLAGTGGFVLAAPYARFLEGEVWPGFSLLFGFALTFAAGEAYQLLVVRERFQESEQKRKQSQQRFEMAAHEMRTPLASIQASSELLATYSLEQPRREQMVKLLHEESQRLARLVERFLSVERLSAGEMELRRAPLELMNWLAALVDRLRPLAERKGVRLLIQSGSDTQAGKIEVAADAELLEFAVSNLVTNAVKYSPAGTEVRVSCGRSGRNAEIAVADSGPGMTAEESRRIFERFYRTDAAEQSGNPGFGLGLAIAHEIARHHGGDVRVESRPGSGSRFTISLPLSSLVA